MPTIPLGRAARTSRRIALASVNRPSGAIAVAAYAPSSPVSPLKLSPAACASASTSAASANRPVLSSTLDSEIDASPTYSGRPACTASRTASRACSSAPSSSIRAFDSEPSAYDSAAGSPDRVAASTASWACSKAATRLPLHSSASDRSAKASACSSLSGTAALISTARLISATGCAVARAGRVRDLCAQPHHPRRSEWIGAHVQQRHRLVQQIERTPGVPGEPGEAGCLGEQRRPRARRGSYVGRHVGPQVRCVAEQNGGLRERPDTRRLLGREQAVLERLVEHLGPGVVQGQVTVRPSAARAERREHLHEGPVQVPGLVGQQRRVEHVGEQRMPEPQQS